MGQLRNRLKTLLLCAVALAGGCQLGQSVAGNKVSDDKVVQLHEGLTKQEVSNLIGSPSARNPLGEDVWVYIGQDIVRPPFRMPVEKSRTVLRLTFLDGKLADVQQKSLEDGNRIRPMRSRTEIEGLSLSLVEQIIGNIGRFQGQPSPR